MTRNAPQKTNELASTDFAIPLNAPNPGEASELTAQAVPVSVARRVANIQHWSRAAFSRFKAILPKDLVNALSYRFEVEQISKYFETKALQYTVRDLTISPDNSFLIDFLIPQGVSPADQGENAGGRRDRYRLLLLFGLHDRQQLSPALIQELRLVSQHHNLDRIVVWTTQHHKPDQVEILKSYHIFIVKILWKEAEGTPSIASFQPNSDYDYAITVQLAANIILRRLKKMFHIILSEVAAPEYDEKYAADQPGTREAMKFEERLVKTTIEKYLPGDGRQIAIDAGCGTGRHAFLLRTDFDRVYGFDFSHAMIERACQKRSSTGMQNMSFEACDFETETISTERYFRGRVDLIVASFGFGSYIEDSMKMVNTFADWLRDDGLLILSCYNPKTALIEMPPNWRDTSLAAHLDSNDNTLRVELTPELVFHIYCKPYGAEIENALRSRFTICETQSFPTALAMMPNSLLRNPNALELYRDVDDWLATHPKYRYGHYITLICQKARGRRGTNK